MLEVIPQKKFHPRTWVNQTKARDHDGQQASKVLKVNLSYLFFITLEVFV